MSGAVLGTTDTKRVTLCSQEFEKKYVNNYENKNNCYSIGTNTVGIKKEGKQNKVVIRDGVKGITELNLEGWVVYQKAEWVRENGQGETF